MTPSDLRTYRLNLGFSQRQMAERLGVNLRSYGRWERGEMRIQHPRMLYLAIITLNQAKELAS